MVHRSRYDEVVDRMSKKYKELIARPAIEDGALGPLISKRQKSIVEDFISMDMKSSTIDFCLLDIRGPKAPSSIAGRAINSLYFLDIRSTTSSYRERWTNIRLLAEQV